MEQILQIPADLQSFKGMSHRSLRVQFDTIENLSDEQIAKITALHEKRGWLSFLVAERQITAEDIKDLPELKEDSEYKSPSERLRSVLWRIWERKGKQGSFEEFRIIWMDKLINQLIQKHLK